MVLSVVAACNASSGDAEPRLKANLPGPKELDAEALRADLRALASEGNIEFLMRQDIADSGESGGISGEGQTLQWKAYPVLKECLSGARRDDFLARGSRSGGGAFKRIALHHAGELRKADGSAYAFSASADENAKLLRRIQYDHQNRSGSDAQNQPACDIGYHLAVDSEGRIYELRDIGFIGAHVWRHNGSSVATDFSGDEAYVDNVGPGSDRIQLSEAAIAALKQADTPNIGILAIGDFQNQEPSVKMLDSIALLFAYFAKSYGLDPAVSIRGHREHNYNEVQALANVFDHSQLRNPGGGEAGTQCPGEHLLARMNTLKTKASELIQGAGTPSGACISEFSDVCADRHHEEITWLATQVFVLGTQSGGSKRFEPARALRLGEAAYFLKRWGSADAKQANTKSLAEWFAEACDNGALFPQACQSRDASSPGKEVERSDLQSAVVRVLAKPEAQVAAAIEGCRPATPGGSTRATTLSRGEFACVMHSLVRSAQ